MQTEESREEGDTMQCQCSAMQEDFPPPPFGFLTGSARTSDISWSHTLDVTGTSPGAEQSQGLTPVAPGDEVRARQLREHLSAA